MFTSSALLESPAARRASWSNSKRGKCVRPATRVASLRLFGTGSGDRNRGKALRRRDPWHPGHRARADLQAVEELGHLSVGRDLSVVELQDAVGDVEVTVVVADHENR